MVCYFFAVLSASDPFELTLRRAEEFTKAFGSVLLQQ